MRPGVYRLNSQNFEKGLLSLKGENKTLKFALLIAMFIAGILAITIMNRSQVVTIVPPNLTQTAWLDKNAASAPYMRAWAIYIAHSLGNATPASVDMLKEAIGPFLDANIYTPVMKRIDDQIDQIKRDRISLSFTPIRVITDPVAPGTFYVEGNQGLEGITGKPVTTPVNFQISIDIQGYRPIVTYININQGRSELPSDAAKRKDKNQQVKQGNKG
ncbi:TraE/TraK family type IV conjugative transfer system protein [Photorhabdus luminescens]|uniref:TraE/TraK family type IV conjugative transfer system protein n=1 Tax=Photorhabdus luminescens TaxID=29488 RepID=UPI0030B85BC0